jgi:hypothetical protein
MTRRRLVSTTALQTDRGWHSLIIHGNKWFARKTRTDAWSSLSKAREHRWKPCSPSSSLNLQKESKVNTVLHGGRRTTYTRLLVLAWLIQLEIGTELRECNRSSSWSQFLSKEMRSVRATSVRWTQSDGSKASVGSTSSDLQITLEQTIYIATPRFTLKDVE